MARLVAMTTNVVDAHSLGERCSVVLDPSFGFSTLQYRGVRVQDQGYRAIFGVYRDVGVQGYSHVQGMYGYTGCNPTQATSIEHRHEVRRIISCSTDEVRRCCTCPAHMLHMPRPHAAHAPPTCCTVPLHQNSTIQFIENGRSIIYLSPFLILLLVL